MPAIGMAGISDLRRMDAGSAGLGRFVDAVDGTGERLVEVLVASLCWAERPSVRAREKEAIMPVLAASLALASSRE